MNGKIHRATVTQADLHYVGSLTIDADLMAAADIVEGEQVHVVDITNGSRLVTYAITGEAGSHCVKATTEHIGLMALIAWYVVPILVENYQGGYYKGTAGVIEIPVWPFMATVSWAAPVSPASSTADSIGARGGW